MSDCNLQEEGMSYIINAFKYKSLKSLNFHGQNYRLSEILAGVSNIPYIMNLNLSSCSFQELGTYWLLTTFKFSSIVSNEETISILELFLSTTKALKI